MLLFLAGLVAWVAAHVGLFSGLPPGVTDAISAAGAVLGLWGIRSAASDPNPLLDLLDKSGQGWKTLTGAIVAAFGYVAADTSALPAKYAGWVQLAGVVLGGLGLYHAASKKGLGS